jgi:hypothetical protein
MSAIQDLLNKKKPTQKSGTASASKSAIASLSAKKPIQGVNKFGTDVSTHAFNPLNPNNVLNQPNNVFTTPKLSLLDRAKGFAQMDVPAMVKSTIKNTSKGTPLETAAAIGSGLLDIAPRIVNSIGTKTAIQALTVTNPFLKPLTDRIPNFQLPLPGKTAMEYSNNNSDLSKALSEATTQVGGFELGGAVTKSLGLPKLAAGVLGNVIGGQAVSDATTVKDRAKQAAMDAAFGAVTEGAGYGLGKLKPKAEIPTITSELPKELPQTPVKTTIAQDLPRSKVISEKPSIVSSEVKSPVETPKKISKVGQSIEARTIEDKLIKNFGETAGYDPKTVADQANRVSQLITEDLSRTKRIVSGAEPIPEGMSSSMFIKGVEDHARITKDVQLLRDLSSSPLASDTSIHAQELRFLRERNPDSPVTAIKDLQTVRETNLQKRGVDVQKAKTSIKSEIKTEIKKASPKPKDWASFVESIKCK